MALEAASHSPSSFFLVLHVARVPVIHMEKGRAGPRSFSRSSTNSERDLEVSCKLLGSSTRKPGLLGACRGPLALATPPHLGDVSQMKRRRRPPRRPGGSRSSFCEVVALTGTSRPCVYTLAGRATTVQPVYRVAP
ncbi:unnamed protein product [Pleuronectes platessa]|uniref:Uncharacterized protein n=1 Tax=Pleuronectes platessa TaxID=8262 RepID=A0A9N7UVP2_PLEPL|nr:unnamed protein product [Pleuronectes platessa]